MWGFSSIEIWYNLLPGQVISNIWELFINFVDSDEKNTNLVGIFIHLYRAYIKIFWFLFTKNEKFKISGCFF